AQGQPERALHQLGKVLATAQRTGSQKYLGKAHLMRGQIAAAAHDWARGEGDLREALAFARKIEYPNLIWRAAHALAAALAARAEAQRTTRAKGDEAHVLAVLAVMKQEVVHPGRPGESSGCQVITYPGQEAWMNVHKNARLTPYRREELVTRALRGEAMAGLAWQCGISIRTARKWLARYRAEGPSGLQDRSSRPHASPRATAPAIQLGIQVLRHQRWTCAQIAAAVGVSAATAARIVRRAGLSRRGRLAPPPPVHRYEHARPGDLLHLDTKKLGRIAGVGHRITGRTGNVNRHHGIGGECLHIAVDDHSRVAYVELLTDDRGLTVAGFLRRALRWFRAHGVSVRRILTDNGSGYRSRSFRATCRALHVGHRCTRP